MGDGFKKNFTLFDSGMIDRETMVWRIISLPSGHIHYLSDDKNLIKPCRKMMERKLV